MRRDIRLFFGQSAKSKDLTPRYLASASVNDPKRTWLGTARSAGFLSPVSLNLFLLQSPIGSRSIPIGFDNPILIRFAGMIQKIRGSSNFTRGRVEARTDGSFPVGI